MIVLSAVAGFASIDRAQAAGAPAVLTGAAAFGDWRTDAPGVRRKITVADLPPPYATGSSDNFPKIVDRPADAMLKVPPGFVVEEFAGGLENPRLVRVAPNGDIFIAESSAGRLRVLRAADNAGKPDRMEIYASNLNRPFGIAFYPPGPDPQYLYVGNTNSVVRFPYRNGDLQARGPAQMVIDTVPGGGLLRGGGHWTRDVIFSRDGSKMLVSVGSFSNDGNDFVGIPMPSALRWIGRQVLGASWGSEELRADVLEANPDGTGLHVFAAGLRNCVGMAVNPAGGELWCSTNERDGMGDNLPPDYITIVREGGFYGWPWYYIGDHEDPAPQGRAA